MRFAATLCSMLIMTLCATQAHAKKHRGGLVTVSTAAGHKITVNRSFAPKITAFIGDLVKRGYKPRRINCHARGGHVSGSRHYAGAACDFDQTGWNKTARPMYRVADLARKHGLRDGCSFRNRDCGHIDDGQRLTRTASRARPQFTRLASRYGHRLYLQQGGSPWPNH